MLYIYTKDYYSTIKNKEWNYGIHRNINGPRDSHTEWSKLYREREICYPLYIECKKKWYKWTCLQNRVTDFRGNPVAKTTSSESRGPGFDPWSEN